MWAGPSAYSQLVPLRNGSAGPEASAEEAAPALGLLFEAGWFSPYQTISFVRFRYPPAVRSATRPPSAPAGWGALNVLKIFDIVF